MAGLLIHRFASCRHCDRGKRVSQVRAFPRFARCYFCERTKAIKLTADIVSTRVRWRGSWCGPRQLPPSPGLEWTRRARQADEEEEERGDEGKHALLAVTPRSAGRLRYGRWFPIVLFLNPDSKTGVKSMRRRLRPESNRRVQAPYEFSIELREINSRLFTARIQLNHANDSWYRHVKDTVRQQQSQPAWVCEAKVTITAAAGILEEEKTLPDLDDEVGSVRGARLPAGTSNSSRPSSRSLDCTDPVDAEAAREARTMLRSQRGDLQAQLQAQLQELRSICLHEAELTGRLPPEFPLWSGERPPHVQRRVEATLPLDKASIRPTYLDSLGRSATAPSPVGFSGVQTTALPHDSGCGGGGRQQHVFIKEQLKIWFERRNPMARNQFFQSLRAECTHGWRASAGSTRCHGSQKKRQQGRETVERYNGLGVAQRREPVVFSPGTGDRLPRANPGPEAARSAVNARVRCYHVRPLYQRSLDSRLEPGYAEYVDMESGTLV